NWTRWLPVRCQAWDWLLNAWTGAKEMLAWYDCCAPGPKRLAAFTANATPTAMLVTPIMTIVQAMTAAESEPLIARAIRPVMTPLLSRSAPHSGQRPSRRLLISYPQEPHEAALPAPGGRTQARQIVWTHSASTSSSEPSMRRYA